MPELLHVIPAEGTGLDCVNGLYFTASLSLDGG
jgi:hypothetical protein